MRFLAGWSIILCIVNRDTFESRLGRGVDVAKLIADVATFYKLGRTYSFKPVQVGYEDFNVILETRAGKWFVKVFSIERSADDIRRYVEVVAKAVEGGVSHPRLKGDSPLFHNEDYNLYAVCMDYVEGESFYKRSGPDTAELDSIMREAITLHEVNYKPPYIFDVWAVPNIDWLYERVDPTRLGDFEPIIQAIINEYHQLDLNQLSTCFVHGDIIKSNVIMSANQPYIVDFSCANMYPKIQELAVMAANLLAKTKHETFDERVGRVVDSYLRSGGTLSVYEKQAVLPYAKAAVAAELLGSIYDEGGTEDEALYWSDLAKDSLAIMK